MSLEEKERRALRNSRLLAACVIDVLNPTLTVRIASNTFVECPNSAHYATALTVERRSARLPLPLLLYVLSSLPFLNLSHLLLDGGVAMLLIHIHFPNIDAYS